MLTPDKEAKKQPVEEPQKYQVVLIDTAPSLKLRPCNAVILTDVFRMSWEEASIHVSHAHHRGRDTVYVTTKDIAETKADQANREREWHSTHNPSVYCLIFTAEPFV